MLDQISDEVAAHLLNPENEILRKFRDSAPGTFHHCDTVSRICEKVGRELKLNLNVLKIIGLYHDIGKMWNSHFFCENQQKDKNIHDSLDPFVSYNYISSHVANSIAIITTQIPEIPIELIRCISMHHGDSVLKSIYNKIPAEDQISPDLFRYPYSKPTDVYACILMIVDTVEATMKALSNIGKVNPDNVEEIIRKCISDLSADEQIDELTIKQSRIIRSVLCAEYAATNQNRINDGYETKVASVEKDN